MISKQTIVGRVRETDDAIIVSVDHYPDFRFEFPAGARPPIENHDFAVWALMPLAMLANCNLRIEGRISERVTASAQLISDIWEKWFPTIFHRVWITADEVFSERIAHEKRLTFFSGGMDSTYSAIRSLRDENTRSDGLIILGMDYKYDKPEVFESLLNKIQVLIDDYLDDQFIVSTDLGELYFRYYYIPEVRRSFTHYLMMASASLYNGYGQYRIASDSRLDKQFAGFPFTNNTALYRVMKSANADLFAMHDEVLRIEKAKYIYESGVDLRAISVCPDKSMQPDNCGVCSKCVRSKLMFLASVGTIPDIFLDNGVGDKWVEVFDASNVAEYSFLSEILSEIENQSATETFPGYAYARERFVAQMEDRKNPSIYNMTAKQIASLLTPRSAYKHLQNLKRKIMK